MERWKANEEKWRKIREKLKNKSTEKINTKNQTENKNIAKTNSKNRDKAEGDTNVGVTGEKRIEMHPSCMIASLLKGVEELEDLKARVKMSKDEYIICEFILRHRGLVSYGEVFEHIEGPKKVKKSDDVDSERSEKSDEFCVNSSKGNDDLSNDEFMHLSSDACMQLVHFCQDHIIEYPLGSSKGKMVVMEFLKYLSRSIEFEVRLVLFACV